TVREPTEGATSLHSRVDGEQPMSRFIRGLTALAVLCLILPARTPGDEPKPKPKPADREEARLVRSQDGVAADPNAGQAQEKTRTGPSRRDHLIRAGHYLINTNRITYAQ